MIGDRLPHPLDITWSRKENPARCPICTGDARKDQGCRHFRGRLDVDAIRDAAASDMAIYAQSAAGPVWWTYACRLHDIPRRR